MRQCVLCKKINENNQMRLQHLVKQTYLYRNRSFFFVKETPLGRFPKVIGVCVSRGHQSFSRGTGEIHMTP